MDSDTRMGKFERTVGNGKLGSLTNRRVLDTLEKIRTRERRYHQNWYPDDCEQTTDASKNPNTVRHLK